MYTQGMNGRPMLAALLLPCCLTCGQDSNARAKASDYPAHAALSSMEIGAEYLVHSIPAQSGVFVAEHMLVVEVAVFPARDAAPVISSDHFRLRVNGKKDIDSQSPGFAAASLKYADWERRGQLSAAADGGVPGLPGVIVGPRAPAPRFPGDTRTSQPVPAPGDTDPSGGAVKRTPDLPIDEQIAKIALPEGPAGSPVKGCVFFPFRGNAAKIRSLDLIYDPGPKNPGTTIRLVTIGRGR